MRLFCVHTIHTVALPLCHHPSLTSSFHPQTIVFQPLPPRSNSTNNRNFPKIPTSLPPCGIDLEKKKARTRACASGLLAGACGRVGAHRMHCMASPKQLVPGRVAGGNFIHSGDGARLHAFGPPRIAKSSITHHISSVEVDVTYPHQQISRIKESTKDDR